MNKMIIAILVALGIGAGGGLYFLDGTPLTDEEVKQICMVAYPEKIKITCEDRGWVCVGESATFGGVKLDLDGTITLDGEEFTKQQILNLKAETK